MYSKKIVGLLALTTIIVLILSSCVASVTSNDTEEIGNQTEEVTMAYDFELVDLDGNTVKLSDYKDKKVYVKFWGTWCPVCVSGLPALTELHEQYIDSDTIILTIVAPGISGELSEERFKEWYNSQEYDFNVLLDPTAETFVEYGIRAFPSSTYVTTDGALSDIKIGHQNNDIISETLNNLN